MGWIWHCILLICALWLGMTSASAQQPAPPPKVIHVLSYYNYPPFVTGVGTGLNYDFFAQLQAIPQHQYRFEFQLVPRRRLDTLLNSSQASIVLFVNEQFFPKSEHDLWLETKLYDSVVVLLRPEFRPKSTHPNHFIGKQFVGVVGHQYPQFEAYIKSGKIEFDPSPNQESVFKKLMIKRGDFSTMPMSTYRYYSQQLSNKNQELGFLEIEDSRFQRKLVLRNVDAQLVAIIKTVLATWPKTKE